MKCALWLNGKKVMSASEIPENFDISAVRGYFLGGCLSEWLTDNGGSEFAEKIEKLSPSDEKLNEKLMEIFGQSSREIKLHTYNSNTHDDNPQTVPCSYNAQNGSFSSGSFSGGSFSGSFGSGSFSLNSFGFGSFGSYSFNSFNRVTSFYDSIVAFIPETGEYISYGSRNPDIAPCTSDGSFLLSDSEYDELVRQSFLRCPLNLFGYGIDNI